MKKIKKDVLLKLILILLSILLISIALTTYFFKEENTVYSSKAVNAMKKYNVYEKINKQSYSETLDIALSDSNFLEKYATSYQEINYIEKENFINEINTLLTLKYTTDEINSIYKYLNEQNISKVLDNKKLDLKEYYSIKNFEVDKLDRYKSYQEENNCTLEEAVLKVNIGLDHDFYTEIKTATNIDEYTVLVNKYNSIEDYEPTDLKSLSYDSKYQLREKAADAFEELVAYGKLNNVYIRPYSAYRSYNTQTTIYNRYVKRDGVSEADTYSARAGHSEHQTGLAVDIWSEGYEYLSSADAKWIEENSYKYGFIVRYTKDNINITGYIEEPWHLRYLGIDIATDVVQKGLTYDEYYDLYLK